jgi:prephenate dehydrogenase
MSSLGVIGAGGSFGAFLVEKLSPHFEVHSYARGNDNVEKLQQVAMSDNVVLSVPLSAYGQVLASIKPFLRINTVLVDVCSVKEKPIQIIKDTLPNQPLLATHPLFGPQSAADSLEGKTIIICEDTTNADVDKFFTELGLIVKRQTAEEHDKLMADVHALTFFVARGLGEYGVSEKAIMTPSFQKLIDLADLEKHHSEDLYNTIQEGNRFAAESRQKLLDLMTELHQGIVR